MFGHHFKFVSDHKPLLALLHKHKATFAQASIRIHRWSLLLLAYERSISFTKTQEHGNADALSRLPLHEMRPDTPSPPQQLLLMNHPVTACHISVWTRRDPVLSKVKDHIEQGWPKEPDKELSVLTDRTVRPPKLYFVGSQSCCPTPRLKSCS